MSDARNILQQLAANREARLGDDDRPRFELREDELERSTHTAMRLAEASTSQVETWRTVSAQVVRAGAHAESRRAHDPDELDAIVLRQLAAEDR